MLRAPAAWGFLAAESDQLIFLYERCLAAGSKGRIRRKGSPSDGRIYRKQVLQTDHRRHKNDSNKAKARQFVAARPSLFPKGFRSRNLPILFCIRKFTFWYTLWAVFSILVHIQDHFWERKIGDFKGFSWILRRIYAGERNF